MPKVTEEVVVRALVHFYNPAQLDVLARAHALAQHDPDPAPSE